MTSLEKKSSMFLPLKGITSLKEKNMFFIMFVISAIIGAIAGIGIIVTLVTYSNNPDCGAPVITDSTTTDSYFNFEQIADAECNSRRVTAGMLVFVLVLLTIGCIGVLYMMYFHYSIRLIE